MNNMRVGTTQAFVLAKGFTRVGDHAALIGEDDTRRLFAEVYADPDRPDVRPQEAYRAILASMQLGSTLRFLQLFWPDPEPRLELQKQVQKWALPKTEGLEILYQGLLLAVQAYPLPFVRRTVLEFSLTDEEGLAWWQGLIPLCAGFGLHISFLDQAAIQELARWVFSPALVYHQDMKVCGQQDI